MEIIADATRMLIELMKSYTRTRQPIEVNFRKLVSWIPYNSERATHLIHPYPAKLLLHIPHFFLANELLSSKNDLVLDPFSGSGTVLLESLLSERNAYGIDANPLARLISKVKTTPLNPKDLLSASTDLKRRITRRRTAPVPEVVNLEHWFHPHVVKQLAIILAAVESTPEPDYRDFFAVCFSCCVRRVSLADLRVAVPVRLNPARYPQLHWLREAATKRLNRLRTVNVFKEFESIQGANMARISELAFLTGKSRVTIVGEDARSPMRCLDRRRPAEASPRREVQVVITSPPYAGAQKYIRASSLSLGWLGLCPPNELRSHEAATIGREHYHKSEYVDLQETGIAAADLLLRRIRERYPLRSHIAANYLCEMRASFEQTLKALKPGGYFVLVAGNNRVCGYNFQTKTYLTSILESQGLSLILELADDIQSRGLMTKRNQTASVITRESVLLFRN